MQARSTLPPYKAFFESWIKDHEIQCREAVEVLFQSQSDALNNGIDSFEVVSEGIVFNQLFLEKGEATILN